MGGADNPPGQEARESRPERLVPGNWHQNPLTCRILRNAGYALDGSLSSKTASVPPPIRTGFGVIGEKESNM
jgi:hypothetical protein